jgi:hypothetical protein
MSSDSPSVTDDRTDLLSLTRTLASAVGGGESLAPGTRFGRYILLASLGEGGMGAVYLAEQTEPVRRRVAIKLSRQRRVSAEELARFAVERQALARMSHPAIAQVFDAGTVEDGTPYFVMEYVEGELLTDFCASRALDLEARIELMRRVCLGVAHAHQKGVIHCDLKPGNILATEVDGQGQPKIIDFGIARALGAGGRDGSSGTPGYMSPEQARGAGDIDTRTDVYSLGLLLHELVSGRPYRDLERLGALSLEGLRDALAQETPRPLPAIHGLPAARRRELDAILARALALKPESRFAGAAQLAEDLGRWQAKLPVEALPDTAGYRLRCMLRRHALAASIAALALLALVGGLIGTGYGLQEANAQRLEAEARRAELEKVVAFQQRLLGSIDVPDFARAWVRGVIDRANDEGGPDAAENLALAARLNALPLVDVARDTLHRQMLEPGAQVIARDFADNPRVQALLRVSLGRTLADLSLLQAAREELDAAARYFDSVGDRHSPAYFHAEYYRAMLDWRSDRTDAAFERLDSLVDEVEAQLPGDAILRGAILAWRGLARYERADFASASRDLAIAAELYREAGNLSWALTNEARSLAAAMAGSSDCDAQGRDRLAELVAEGRDRGVPDRTLANVLQIASHCHSARGEVRETVATMEQSYRIQLAQAGADDADTQMVHGQWWASRLAHGEIEDAESAIRQAIERSERTGLGHTSIHIGNLLNLAELHSLRGEHGEALALVAELSALVAAGDSGAKLLSQLMVGGQSAVILARAGKQAEAVAQSESFLRLCSEAMGGVVADCIATPLRVARALTVADLQAQAFDDLLELDFRVRTAFAPDHPYQLISAVVLAEAARRSGRVDDLQAHVHDRLGALDLVDLDQLGFEEAGLLAAHRLRELTAP